MYDQTALPFAPSALPKTGDSRFFLDPSDSPAPSPSALLQKVEDEERRSRDRESLAISDRYQKTLESRGVSHTMSPDFVATQPTSLKQRLRVTPQEEEDILFHFAATASLPAASRLSGVSLDKVRAVVYAPEAQDKLASLRSAMRASIIRKIEETQTILLDAIQTPSKLDAATLSQLTDVFTKISETQVNLLSAASRSSSAYAVEVDPTTVFSGDELEYMAFLRRRLSASGESNKTALPHGESTGAFGNSQPADEILEGAFGNSQPADEILEGAFDVSPSAIEVDISAPSTSTASTTENSDDLTAEFLRECFEDLLGDDDPMKDSLK